MLLPFMVASHLQGVRLKFVFDCAEPRTIRDRLVASVDGSNDGWDMTVSQGVFLDPTTRTLMALPLPYSAAWAATYSADYARLRLTDFSIVSGDIGKFIEHPVLNPGDWYLEGPVNSVVTTADTYPVNQPWYISQFMYGTSTQRAVLMECGWGEPGVGVSLRFSADGQIQVYKDTTCVGVYGAGSNTLGGKKQLAGSFVNWALIPCRGRDLLILSDSGVGGVAHTFTDLPNDADVHTICAAGAFWWRVPSGRACVQCTPLKFSDAGLAYGRKIKLPYAPATGRTFSVLDAYVGAGYGTQSVAWRLVEADSLATAFVANGVKRDVRVELQLGTDGDSTAFVYAADAICPRVAGSTVDDPFDITAWIASYRLDVPENGPATISFTAFNGDALADAGLNRPAVIGDRPFRLAVMMPGEGEDPEIEVDVFRGTTGKPDINRGAGMTRAMGTLLSWIGTDRDKQFELCKFRSTLPYDGYSLGNTVIDLATLPGFASTDLDISADTYLLQYSPTVSRGDWKLLPDRGDSVGEWLQRLHHDNAATWITGWSPTATGYKYRWRRLDTYSTTPVMKLYVDRADALAAGVSPALVPFRVIRDIRDRPEEAEANQVSVIGWDERTREYISAQFDDAASQDPTLAVAARPENWRGQVVSYTRTDENITTQDSADRGCDILAERIATGRRIIEIDCEFLVRTDAGHRGVPAWKGDRLEIREQGDVLDGIYRVLSFFVEGEREILEGDDPGQLVRWATYVLEFLPGEPAEDDDEDEE